MSQIGIGFILVLALAATNVIAADVESEPVDAADVLVAVALLGNDIEIVRAYLGKAKATPTQFRVEKSSNRHTFNLAQALFRKISLFGSEVAGTSTVAPPFAPDREITHLDVLNVVQSVHRRLGTVKEELGIVREPEQPDRRAQADKTEVLESMLQVLRQVNLMLMRRYLPEDVYERIDLATVYAAGIIQANGGNLYPDVELVLYKQPVEVFRKLLDCLELTGKIGARMDIDVLQLDFRRMRTATTRLSNNYDLASILLIDVAVLAEALEGSEETPREDMQLPHIVPSHVFRKATQLEQQLETVLAGL